MVDHKPDPQEEQIPGLKVVADAPDQRKGPDQGERDQAADTGEVIGNSGLKAG